MRNFSVQELKIEFGDLRDGKMMITAVVTGDNPRTLASELDFGAHFRAKVDHAALRDSPHDVRYDSLGIRRAHGDPLARAGVTLYADGPASTSRSMSFDGPDGHRYVITIQDFED